MSRRREFAADDAEVQIPIPAMLDVTFQLLAFCILTWHPPGAAEGQMDLFLPAAGVAKAADDADPFAPSAPEADPPTELIVVVESAGGQIGGLAIREREATTRVENVAALRTELTKLKQELGRVNATIEAPGDLRYSELVAVMDACLAAKVTSVGFAPPR